MSAVSTDPVPAPMPAPVLIPRRALSPSRWTLRARLVALLIVLTSGVTLAVGGASVLALERQMRGQLDTQLEDAARRTQVYEDDPKSAGADDEQGAPVDFGPAQGEGTLIAQLGRTPRGGVLGGDGSTQALSSGQLAMLQAVPTSGRHAEVDLGGALGDYLVSARSQHDGQIWVTGLPLSGARQPLLKFVSAFALLGIVGVLLSAAAALVVVRLALRPLSRVVATARRVAELPLERGDVALHERVPMRDTDPHTEVGQVGAAINRMLGHIDGALAVRTASEARMRRFVADASHELRTPLASIRGYAELTRRQDGQLPPQVSHAVGRVESEAVRMTGLVEDLLLLARLDESPQAAAMRRDPVDLSAIVVDCVSDAHLLDPHHAWQLDLPDEPVTVTGDAARLRQVLTNLLANARVHTPAGTTVRVRLAHQDGGAVMMEVEDDGPGIPPALMPAVFDRFARADSSRSRAAGSTGLGLAIVASVVQAHGGDVSVTSAPGRTTFRVTLPSG